MRLIDRTRPQQRVLEAIDLLRQAGTHAITATAMLWRLVILLVAIAQAPRPTPNAQRAASGVRNYRNGAENRIGEHQFLRTDATRAALVMASVMMMFQLRCTVGQKMFAGLTKPRYATHCRLGSKSRAHLQGEENEKEDHAATLIGSTIGFRWQ